MLIIDTDKFPHLGKHHDESDESHTVGVLTHLEYLLEESADDEVDENILKEINDEIKGINALIEEHGDIKAKLDINI